LIFRTESVCQAAKLRLHRWTKPANLAPVLDVALDLRGTNSGLLLENTFLWRQLIALKRQGKRPALTWRPNPVCAVGKLIGDLEMGASDLAA
jgi:hypothetical protein